MTLQKKEKFTNHPKTKTMKTNNQLIAEFMGLKPALRSEYNSEIHTNVIEDLSYDTSWNWLMLAVNKCYETNLEKAVFLFELSDFLNGNIDSIHNAVIRFIKWDNENNS